MINAASPMIGGIICPAVEAVASIAPAIDPWYPYLRIIGTVRRPVNTTFDTACPMIDATIPEPIIAGPAEPPDTLRPAILPTSRTISNMPTPSRIAA